MITNTIQRMVGRTKADTNVMAILANKRTVATTRTGLNMVSSCFLNPLPSQLCQ